MKKTIFIIFIISIFSCNPQNCPVLTYNELNKMTYGDNNLPYTGRCVIYIDGKISSIQQYLNGKDYGKWTFYHSNGRVETKGKFNEFGQRSGKWKYYYKNGELKQISKYSNGERVGKWSVYDSIGRIMEEINY